MNRHPAVLARMASTLQIASGGRLVLGIGIGGASGASTRPTASTSRGRPSGSPGSRRPWRSSARCGPAARSARPSPVLPAREAPRLSRAGAAAADHRSAARRPAGARLAGRIGDGWTRVRATTSRRTCRSTSSRSRHAGRRREDQRVVVSASRATGWRDESLRRHPVGRAAPRETWARWRAAGADGAIVLARTTERRGRPGARGGALVAEPEGDVRPEARGGGGAAPASPAGTRPG